MATERQIEANRRNALLSTGPKTEEGKAASRANALKHGLTGAGVVVEQEEVELIDRYEAEWNSCLKPYNAFEVQLARRVAVEMVRLERCEREERAVRARLAERADACWDLDRRIEAEELGGGLARQPALIARKLERTPQGCDWLIERWQGLARALEHAGSWTDAQRTLALDLLGVPGELRGMPTRLDPAPGGDPNETRAEVARAEVARLTAWKDSLRPLDQREREDAARGEAVSSPELDRLRRYEASCHRRLSWTLKQFKNGRHDYAPVGRDPWASTASCAPSPTPTPTPPPPTRPRATVEVAGATRPFETRTEAISILPRSAPEPPAPTARFDRR